MMQPRTMAAVGGACILYVTYAAWLLLPDSWALARSVLRDVGMFGWPMVGVISLFATPAGYSDDERRTTPPARLWWTYFFLVPSVPLGFMAFLWLLSWM
jgi:hypothetical protein